MKPKNDTGPANGTLILSLRMAINPLLVVAPTRDAAPNSRKAHYEGEAQHVGVRNAMARDDEGRSQMLPSAVVPNIHCLVGRREPLGRGSGLQGFPGRLELSLGCVEVLR